MHGESDSPSSYGLAVGFLQVFDLILNKTK